VTTMSRRPFPRLSRAAGGAPLLIAGLLAGVAAAVVAGEAGADRVGERLREILLGDAGQVLFCPGCPEDRPVRVDVGTGLATQVPLPYYRVNDLALLPDRKRFLAATSSERGKQSLLVILAVDSLAPLGRVEIPGNGLRVAPARDGYFAYVLCHRPERGRIDEDDSGQWELLGVDLGASAVTETYPLSAPATSLALTPDGDRLYLAMRDRVLSFTTRPLTASWYYRSPGENRNLAVRPGKGQVFVLREAEIAVFEPGRRKPSGEAGQNDGGDDAARTLSLSLRLERIAFSADGALAVASGNSLERLLLLDGETSRVVGVYPEETSALENFLDALDSSRPKPAGPRGKLLTPQPGFSPPLRTPLPPAPPSAGFPPAGPLDAGTPAETPPAGKPGATREARSQREPQRGSGPEGAAPANGASHPEEASVLEEVADPFLSGRITGALSLVGAVILYGPDSITTERDRVTPQSDGTYRFSLPSKGRYRIVLAGSSRTTLSCRPAFQTIEVGDYGYRGLDFEVRGAVGGR